MTSIKTMIIVALAAGAAGAFAPAQAAEPGEPARWLPQPAEVCSARSMYKHYTLADAQFAAVRDQLNATLARVPAEPGAILPKAAGFHIPLVATQFGLRLDHARCDTVGDPAEELWSAREPGGYAKDCREAGCEDPAPGWTAPEGSIMVIWSCVNSVMREVEYEKVNGIWRVKSVREERVVSCPLPKDPEGGGDPKPEPEKG